MDGDGYAVEKLLRDGVVWEYAGGMREPADGDAVADCSGFDDPAFVAAVAFGARAAVETFESAAGPRCVGGVVDGDAAAYWVKAPAVGVKRSAEGFPSGLVGVRATAGQESI
jgi:hypothetical protein